MGMLASPFASDAPVLVLVHEVVGRLRRTSYAEDERQISFTRQPDCDHMLGKSCSRTACHKRCPTHPPLPASSHTPEPSPASTAMRRRPSYGDPTSHRR